MIDNDLKKLWDKQEVIIPDTKEFFEKTKKFKMSNLKKIIITNILFLLTTAFILFVWFNYQPEIITTKIGIVLIIFAMILFLFVYNQLVPLLIKVEYDINNSKYLKQLIKIKEKQFFIHTIMLNIYFILLSLGICIYMIEFVLKMSLLSGILAYGVTILWISFNWVYIRPRTLKKHETKINDLISKFEGLNRQLNNID